MMIDDNYVFHSQKDIVHLGGAAFAGLSLEAERRHQDCRRAREAVAGKQAPQVEPAVVRAGRGGAPTGLERKLLLSGLVGPC